MAIAFHVIDSRGAVRTSRFPYVALRYDNWDDFGFKTMFIATWVEGENSVDLGSVKLGFKGQAEGRTFDVIEKSFAQLPEGWFSLGQDVDYYKNIRDKIPQEFAFQLLGALRDIALDDSNFANANDERVFGTSLTRSVSVTAIKGQFQRILGGDDELTDFDFRYVDNGNDRRASADLEFNVEKLSTPPTNIHVLIGRNGVGKTTLLNRMVQSILNPTDDGVAHGRFLQRTLFGFEEAIPANYFSSVVSISFSAFDPFVPPRDRTDRSKGTAYFYVGMKRERSEDSLESSVSSKSTDELASDLISGIGFCFSQSAKRTRWLSAVRRLQSDTNFAEMGLEAIADIAVDDIPRRVAPIVRRMSSGHAIVLLSITKLVSYVEEKTLVLMDEPESHLHPPLLSAFMRAISDLLRSRNGVAIIATHSPVVAQEVPKSCVWKLTRLGIESRADRPERETFGENVGILTREIFGLEVAKSGFHEMLEREVSRRKSFEAIVGEYGGQLGHEAKAILMSLIDSRDSFGAN